METKKTVLNEAIVEFNELMEAAQKKAKDDMAKEFPEKFEKSINEYLEKLNTMKENIKDKKENIDEKAETVEVGKTYKEPAKTKKSKEMGKTKDAETRTDMGKGVDSKVENTYTEEPKKGKNKKVNESTEEDIDLTDFSMEELEEAFDGANDDDEFQFDDEDNDELEIDLGNSDVDLDDIENELAKMDSMSEEFEVDENVNDPYTQLKKLQEEMNQIIDNISNGSNEESEDDTVIQEFDEKMSGVYGENYKEVLGTEYDKMLDLYKNQKTDEPEHFDDDQDIEISMDDDNEQVEEAHGISLSNNKNAGSNTQPRPEYADYKKNKLRAALQKEQYEKRIKSLVSENKNTKINFNKLKKKTNDADKLLENYRSVIGKYRDRLNEMVVFNTNLAHTNNLLMNENFDLSFDDKKEIVDKFKPVETIDESEKVYKNILKDKSGKKDKVVESIEKKYNNANAITPSSKQKIGETVEKSAYKNDEHVSRIKKLMNYDSDRNK